jgi:hypothetical protein
MKTPSALLDPARLALPAPYRTPSTGAAPSPARVLCLRSPRRAGRAAKCRVASLAISHVLTSPSPAPAPRSQDTQIGEAIMQALGAPWESANKYRIAALPDGRFAIKEQGQAGAWAPSHEELKALPPLMSAVEQSGDCTRICFTCMGIGNLRPLTMHYYNPQVRRQEPAGRRGLFDDVARPVSLGASTSSLHPPPRPPPHPTSPGPTEPGDVPLREALQVRRMVLLPPGDGEWPGSPAPVASHTLCPTWRAPREPCSRPPPPALRCACLRPKCQLACFPRPRSSPARAPGCVLSLQPQPPLS